MTIPSSDAARSQELPVAVSQTWKRFLEVYEPLRPALATASIRGSRRARSPHRGELLLVSWYAHRDGEFVRAISRVELSSDGDRIARLRNYFYIPEVIAELCGELDLPYRTNGTFRARGAA